MREHEMQTRIERFLKARMRAMLAPALGLGMAVAGCKQEVATPRYSAPLSDGSIDKAAQIIHDTGLVSTDGQKPDAPLGIDKPVLAIDAAIADAKDGTTGDIVESAADTTKADQVAHETGMSDTGKADAGADPEMDARDGGADTRRDLGFAVKYMAPFQEVGSPALRYMAQMPDSDS